MNCLSRSNEDQLKSRLGMSLRSRRKSLAQGEASEASGTLGCDADLDIEPALAGDRSESPQSRFCRPLKRAGNPNTDRTQGGAPLHFVSLRLPWARLCRLLRRLAEQSPSQFVIGNPAFRFLTNRMLLACLNLLPFTVAWVDFRCLCHMVLNPKRRSLPGNRLHSPRNVAQAFLFSFQFNARPVRQLVGVLAGRGQVLREHTTQIAHRFNQVVRLRLSPNLLQLEH